MSLLAGSVNALEEKLGEWTFPGPNPIAQYMLGLELRTPLSQETLKAIAGAHRLFRHDLPRATQQQAVTMQMGFGASTGLTTGIGGVTFERIGADGIIAAGLNVQPLQINYMVTRYQRWNEHWPVADRIFETLFQLLPQDGLVNAFMLHSVNKFSCVDGESIDVSSLISNEGGLISANLITCKSLAHCFHGFQTTETNPPGNRIDNVNLTLNGSEAGLEIDLTFNIRFIPTEAPSLKALQVSDSAREPEHAARFRQLHERNNFMFTQVIARSHWRSIPGLGDV